MKTNGEITVAAATTWLPETRQTPDAVGTTAEDAGYEALAVSDDLSAPQMAELAARAALGRAGWEGDSVRLLLHAWSYYQGHDFWSPAHYLADRLGAGSALPVGIQQMCNGGAAALQSAAAHLLADPALDRALVTTADRFCPPGFDRWSGDLGVAYGDGAAAVLLTRTGAGETADSAPAGGALRLLSVASVAAPELEAMHRGHDAFAPAPRWLSGQVDARRTKKAYLRAHGSDGYRDTERRALRSLVTSALDDAGLAPDDPALRLVVLPRLQGPLLAGEYVPLLADLTRAEPADFGRTTGHLGAGDLLAGIADLTEQKLLAAGESALVLSTGAGFTWSCAVVRMPS
jgi:3-oxoacyl-[acyl-carrier-protein] synthase-3